MGLGSKQRGMMRDDSVGWIAKLWVWYALPSQTWEHHVRASSETGEWSNGKVCACSMSQHVSGFCRHSKTAGMCGVICCATSLGWMSDSLPRNVVWRSLSGVMLDHVAGR
eukprot:1053173-Pyramimonas_sp.AAC.1